MDLLIFNYKDNFMLKERKGTFDQKKLKKN